MRWKEGERRGGRERKGEGGGVTNEVEGGGEKGREGVGGEGGRGNDGGMQKCILAFPTLTLREIASLVMLMPSLETIHIIY